MAVKKRTWYDDAFCLLHWDYDNPYFVKLARGFDPKSFAKTLKSSGVEGVVFFATDCFGHCLYNTKIGKRHPGLKFDLLRKVTDACHSVNIRVIHYFVALNQVIAEAHPDWVFQPLPEEKEKAEYELARTTGGDAGLGAEKKKGAPNPHIRICLNSPFIEEYIIPLVIELCETYEPDGFLFDMFAQQTHNKLCYCKYCEEKFQKDFKTSIPRDSSDPLWFKYIPWYVQSNIAFEKRVAEVIKSRRPETVIVNNWSTAMRRLYPATPEMDFLCGDPWEGWGQNPLYSSAIARFLVTEGKPFNLHNTRMLQWWSDWMLRPTVAMKQDAATVIANGGGVFIGDKLPPECTLDPTIMQAEKEVFAFANQRRAYVKDASPVPYIGILHSRSTYNYKTAMSLSKSHNSGEKVYPVLGAHRALVNSSMPFVIFTEDNLKERLSGLQTLVITGETYLSRETLATISEFVKNGGGLVATYDSGMFNEDGKLYAKSPLDEVFGIRRDLPEEVDNPLHYIVPSDRKLKKYAGEFPLMIHANAIKIKKVEGATKIADLVPPLWHNVPGIQGPLGKNTGESAVLVNSYGRGRVAYAASDFLRVYYERGNPPLRLLMKYLVDFVTKNKLIEVKAPPCIEVTLFQQKDRWIVHLINFHNEKIPADRNTIGIIYSEEIPPVHDIQVRLKVPFKVKRVMLQPEGRRLKFKKDKKVIVVTIPKVHIHSMVVIEHMEGG